MNPLLLTLFRKDLLVLRKMAPGLLVTGVLVTGLALALDHLELIVPLLMAQLASGFVMVSSYQDERNNSYRFLLSMPLERSDLARARYLSIAAVLLGATLLLALLQLSLAGLIRGLALDLHTSPMSAALLLYTLAAVLALVSVLAPIRFRYSIVDAEQALRMITLCVIALAFALEWLLRKLAELIDPGLLGRLGEQWAELDHGLAASLVLLAAVGVFGASYPISVRSLERREF